MKTLIIFNLVPEQIKYFVVEGVDIQHLDGCYINNDPDVNLEKELLNLMYDDMGGFIQQEFELDDIDISEISKIIEAGFIL